MKKRKEQGRIHRNLVANAWAGALMRKPLVIQKRDGWTDGQMDGRMDGRTDQPTDRHGKV